MQPTPKFLSYRTYSIQDWTQAPGQQQKKSTEVFLQEGKHKNKRHIEAGVGRLEYASINNKINNKK